MNKKLALKSKSIWLGVITAILPLVSNDAVILIQENTAAFGMIWGAVAVVLRFVTKDEIVLTD